MTAYPSPRALRSTIEHQILQLYTSDNVTLKPIAEWPGYYTLTPKPTRIPAVYAVGKHIVPSAWGITGIECVIEDVPEIVDKGTRSGLVSIEEWNIRFTNYGSSEGTKMLTSMLDIKRRLARAFPGDPTTYMTRTDSTFEALTARIRIAVLNPPIP